MHMSQLNLPHCTGGRTGGVWLEAVTARRWVHLQLVINSCILVWLQLMGDH